MRHAALSALAAAMLILGAVVARITHASDTPLVVKASVCAPGQEGRPVRTLVANQTIPKGTSGSAIVARRMYSPFTLPCGEREPGAITEPALLKSLVAALTIFKGQQLTRIDFVGVLKVSLTNPVRRGDYASLTVSVLPRARCTIQVIYDTVVSKAKGLGPKTGGKITWRWRVGTSTHPGRWPIIVNCGASGKLRTAIKVLSR